MKIYRFVEQVLALALLCLCSCTFAFAQARLRFVLILKRIGPKRHIQRLRSSLSNRR